MKKFISSLLAALMLCNFLPAISASAASQSTKSSSLPPQAKDDSLDPDLNMVSGNDYSDNVKGKPGAKGDKYTIKHPTDAALGLDDYMNDMNWYVDVQGYSNKTTLKRKRIKMMPLLRPIRDGSLGRLIALPSDLDYWTKNFNGNKEFVSDRNKSFPMKIVNNKTKKEIYRLYIRDLAMWSGATVQILGTGYFDEGQGNELSTALVTTTSYPDATVSVPAKAKIGETLSIEYTGKEFYPEREYSKRKYIGFTLKVNDKVIKSSYRQDKQFNLSEEYKFDKKGTYKISLVVTDQVNRSFTATKTVVVGDDAPPPAADNKPPVADVNVRPFYYWPETVDISTTAYDPDGEIANEELSVDGEPIDGKQWKSPRVTEKIPHNVYYTVTDDAGATADASDEFEIWPTTPIAAATMDGTLKENRAVSFDAKASDLKSPIEVAPIDYNLTSWEIVPISEGLSKDDIKYRPSSDPSIKQVLFKKKGKYELHLTVTNVFDETSEVYVKELDVAPDVEPITRFTVDKSVYLRDNDDGQYATITLRDDSVSTDGDSIGQRIWYVEFDANNDGVFGTAADGGKQVISSSNERTITYKTKHVGHYRFSLYTKEKFGEPTYEEFIQPQDYRTDDSDIIDKNGSVNVYMKPENFNIPTADKAIEVNNVPPIIDFGVKRQNSVHVALDFGGMDEATLEHKTGSRPGGGVNNGGGGGSYNHYYYSINQDAKNQLTAYAGSLESDLRMKGIDAKIDINNTYYHENDLDGECVLNIPIWGYVDHGYYVYDSYSGTSPYSGSWEVTSSSSEPIIEVTWCYLDNSANGGQIHSHAPPCTDGSNAIYGQTGTKYTASLRKWISDYRFEITGYTNSGCNSEEKVDTTDFTTEINKFTFNHSTYKYYFRMDKNQWTWANNSSKRNQLINKLRSDNAFFWSNSNGSLRSDAQSIINSIGQGTFTQYSEDYLQSNVEKVRTELINKFMMEENPESMTIVLGDKVDYTTKYTDFENDPEIQREWKFIHGPTSVNGRVIDSQPDKPIAQSGLYISSPMQLNEVGTYTVTLRAKDNPLSNVGNDTRFSNYKKWSDEETVREFKINVHRRPIADFTYTIEPGTLKLTLDPNTSYDPDHRYNWAELKIAERGIVEYTWEKYVVDGVEHQGEPPKVLQPYKDYFVTLRVKDVDGAYGTVTKHLSTKEVNLKPVALFDAPDVVLDDTRLDVPDTQDYIQDRSYDPNGDPLTNYNWTIKKQGDNRILWSSSNYPTSFKSIGLGEGKYVIGLTVWDIPKYPPSLQSELYERPIQVVHNNPPNSCFELSPGAISTSSISCTDGMESPHTLFVDASTIYTDKSSDPDGHPLINYSWDIEKLNEKNEVTQKWNTGSPPTDFSIFGGVGKYRVTQTVFDLPPAPLRSLSGKLSKIYNVILGPQAPYAMFDYSPLLPIGGDTIQLHDQSWDEDGTVVKWDWEITAPNGQKNITHEQHPKISNAQVGTYKVSLHVWDDTKPDSLRSKLPAYKEIVVSEPPPNKPPVAMFVWKPFQPFLGEEFKLDPDGSYDVDGKIVSYQWDIRSKEGTVTHSNTRYPTLTATSEYYDVTLTVRDNDGATDSVTHRIKVNIARLVPLVTHMEEWKKYWVSEGQDPDVNIFLAGERFVIRLKTTPANRVEGKVDFGGVVGEIEIPSTSFKLVSTSQYEYIWETELWRDDFDRIADGEYNFEFKGYHPVNNPYVESKGNYLIKIQGSIYEALKFHRNY
ncbi:PKD domain-containing protein [Bacillus sp. 1P06AnD]|uniref:PKD domain-containing protein n=1 Tax=Bacillus sp. 1P06AnD TaxID=3132208 RepID=UPI0039A1BCA0